MSAVNLPVVAPNMFAVPPLLICDCICNILLGTAVVENKSDDTYMLVSNTTFLMAYIFFIVDIWVSVSDNNVANTVNGIVARTSRSSPTVFIVSKLTDPIVVGNFSGPFPHENLPYGNICSTTSFNCIVKSHQIIISYSIVTYFGILII